MKKFGLDKEALDSKKEMNVWRAVASAKHYLGLKILDIIVV